MQRSWRAWESPGQQPVQTGPARLVRLVRLALRIVERVLEWLEALRRQTRQLWARKIKRPVQHSAGKFVGNEPAHLVYHTDDETLLLDLVVSDGLFILQNFPCRVASAQEDVEWRRGLETGRYAPL